MVLREKMCDVCKKQRTHKQVDSEYGKQNYTKQNEGNEEKMQSIVIAEFDDPDYWECLFCKTISFTPEGSLL